jgi:hypothetical protein
MLVHKTIQQV